MLHSDLEILPHGTRIDSREIRVDLVIEANSVLLPQCAFHGGHQGDDPVLDGLGISCYKPLKLTGALLMSQIMQLTVPQFERMFPNEDACDAFLVARRWPNGPSCPRCGSDRVYPLATMKYKWECPDCREGGAYRFSHLVGTIFENTKVDLREWFRVIHLILTAKKGVSARQVHRYMGFGSYQTAWYMCHRIRAALVDPDFRKLMVSSRSMKPTSAARIKTATRISALRAPELPARPL
jgi:hypothetical protein